MFRQIDTTRFRFDPALWPEFQRRREDGGVIVENQRASADRSLQISEHMHRRKGKDSYALWYHVFFVYQWLTDDTREVAGHAALVAEGFVDEGRLLYG
jgi:hypothetical protein